MKLVYPPETENWRGGLAAPSGDADNNAASPLYLGIEVRAGLARLLDPPSHRATMNRVERR